MPNKNTRKLLSNTDLGNRQFPLGDMAEVPNIERRLGLKFPKPLAQFWREFGYVFFVRAVSYTHLTLPTIYPV